jgi:hypothetical protein
MILLYHRKIRCGNNLLVDKFVLVVISLNIISKANAMCVEYWVQALVLPARE